MSHRSINGCVATAATGAARRALAGAFLFGRGQPVPDAITIREPCEVRPRPRRGAPRGAGRGARRGDATEVEPPRRRSSAGSARRSSSRFHHFFPSHVSPRPRHRRDVTDQVPAVSPQSRMLAAPTATVTSGSISRFSFETPMDFRSSSRMCGTRLVPPTKTTSSTSFLVSIPFTKVSSTVFRARWKRCAHVFSKRCFVRVNSSHTPLSWCARRTS